MTDHTLNEARADKGSVLRPWVIAVVMIAAGLGLLFWDNGPADNTPPSLIVVSQIH